MEGNKNLSDPELVENLRTGKRVDETIGILYRDHFNSLSWYVINNNGSRQDAEDIFQEVMINFIDLVQKNGFRGESSTRTFLFSMNRHIWLNELKKRGRALAREEKYERIQDRTVVDVSQMIVERETRMQVASLVDQLGEHCKKILLLFYYENQPMKIILEQMHYDSEQVVRNKKYKCLKQLEMLIQENPTLMQNLKNLLHG